MHAGFLLVDKPAGITSHDVVDRVRRITGERTVGHAGTLDPFATGLLIIAVGRAATKHLQSYVGLDKEYEAEICIGRSSTTLDPEGTIEEASKVTVTPEQLTNAAKQMTGELLQIPPMHAAIKVQGKKLYELARKGIEIERAPRPVTIHEFAVHAPTGLNTWPITLHARIVCSSGTYIRAIARDLGETLGTQGYLTALRRTKIGNFTVDEAKKLEELSPENWIDSCRATMLRSES